MESKSESESALIRAIIIARGPNGATLEDIKHDFKTQIGEPIENENNNQLLRKRVESIHYVRSENRNGSTVFFTGAPLQEHLVAMVRNQRKSRSPNHRKPKAVVRDSNGHEYPHTPKARMDSTISRRNRFHDSLLDNSSNEKLMGRAPASSYLRQSIKRKCSPPPESCDVNRNAKVFRSDPTNQSSSFDITMSQISDTSLKKESNPFLPEYYKCVLVGDNFFLNLAVMDMNYRMMKYNRILRSGYCISSQTIREATRNIEEMPGNQIIILNIGSTDIAEGKELIDLICGIMRLFHACVNNNITPILTTLAPLLNYRTANRAEVTNGFNDFLRHNPFKFPVIDLNKAFLNSRGLADSRFYQQTPRHVSGMRNQLVFWNRFGHKTAMRILKQELGLAFLQILMK